MTTQSNYNLPPGVTDDMIPGSTPADVELEQFADWLVDILSKNPQIDINHLKLCISLHIQELSGYYNMERR